jgi:acyl-CoA reductase-like NAD-dependent aldehyde dehydrogenase
MVEAHTGDERRARVDVQRAVSEEQVAIASGNGSAFSSLPFDHLVFTGSAAVGRAVLLACAVRKPCGYSSEILLRGRL